MLVGEVFQLFQPDVTRFYGRGDELHLAFDLPRVLYTPWNADAWRERTRTVHATHGAVGAWPTLVLSNHDTPRHRTRLGSEARARAAVVLLLTLPGTPFLYAGEELGLEDAVVPLERRVDPGGRDGCRAPIPWDASPRHGWAANPWLPWPPEAGHRAVAVQRDDPSSILRLYRRLLAERRASPALHTGNWRAREAPDGVLAYERDAGTDRRLVLVNFTESPVRVEAGGRVTVASDGIGEGHAFSGILGPDTAIVLA
jgi:alpha-glucosidase